MVEKPLTRTRGGFMRAFGAAVFIRDYLAGEGPRYGVAAIEPDRGSPQADIHAAYKSALHQTWAENMVATQQERRIKEGAAPLTIEEADRLLAYYLERTPYKLTRMRYHSFLVYFGLLKRLGWVELTDEEEASTIQEYYPPASPRRFYRLTTNGRQATTEEVRDPVQTVYDYPRSIRSARKPPPEKPAFMEEEARPSPPPPPPVEEVRPPPPPPPEEEEEVPEAVQERWDTLAERIKGWARPRPADAERLLGNVSTEMEDAGIELEGLDDALGLLQEYRDTTREDFEDAEEFREARADAWQEFLNALDEVELRIE